jgi:hypothetical protein
MALDLLNDKGVPLDRQKFTWKDLVRTPYSKLNEDAFSRVRVILMNGIEAESVRFSHAAARMNRDLQLMLAKIRRIEQHQETLVNWLNPPDQSPLETTIGYEQTAIEITAAIAQRESEPYLAQVYRYGLLEDFDHLYRFTALMDRLEGKDANNILQSYTDIRVGRPTVDEHRAPEDDLRDSYVKNRVEPLTKLHALTIVSAEHQVRDYYMNIGPLFSDPVARQLYAEIVSIEEQHVTQYECLPDPSETWLEKWLLHEANEAYNYWSCLENETNPRLRSIWERFLEYELGHVAAVSELMKSMERRDPAQILGSNPLDEPLPHRSHREFVRRVLQTESELHSVGRNQFVPKTQLPSDNPSVQYRRQLNSEGSPSETVAASYRWTPGTELFPQDRRLQ